jgi:3-methyladenine DNA glycosylase AlkD
MNPYAETLVQELKIRSVPQKADWWNNYLKGEIRFVGISIPDIRKLLIERNFRDGLDRLPMNQQVGMVNGLMRSPFAEHKLTAILYIQLFWLKNQRNTFLLSLFTDWFDERYIYDWNTTDWLCVKLLTPILDSGDEKVLWVLKRWNRDPYLWKARASLVPFAHSSRIREHSKTIERFADILIRREERFAKSTVGWVLREYSRVDEAFVFDFLNRHAKHVTWDVKRNALKYHRQKLKKP